MDSTTTPEAVNVEQDSTAPEIGDTMEDGTIYAGVSPDTNEPMYVTPADAPGTLKWKQAMKYAADLDADGHKDRKLPTETELNVIFKNRHKGALEGTFNESGSVFAGWYWSSKKSCNLTGDAWMQDFNDGEQSNWWNGNGNLSLRCLRTSCPVGASTVA